VALTAASVGMLCTGTYAASVRSRGTYVDLGAHGSYRTDRYALATDSTDWARSWFGWAGSVQLKVTATGPEPIFVGVGSPRAVNRYLTGTGYTTLAERSGRDPVRTDHDGGPPQRPLPDGGELTARAEGKGIQTRRWDAAHGPQVAFAMNADGSAPVRVRIVSAEVTLDRMPWWVPAAAFVLGVGLLPLGVVLLRPLLRRRRLSSRSPRGAAGRRRVPGAARR
jgi:hypothetical protein